MPSFWTAEPRLRGAGMQPRAAQKQSPPPAPAAARGGDSTRPAAEPRGRRGPRAPGLRTAGRPHLSWPFPSPPRSSGSSRSSPSKLRGRQGTLAVAGEDTSPAAGCTGTAEACSHSGPASRDPPGCGVPVTPPHRRGHRGGPGPRLRELPVHARAWEGLAMWLDRRGPHLSVDSPGSMALRGGVLGTPARLAASLASTHQMPLTPHSKCHEQKRLRT